MVEERQLRFDKHGAQLFAAAGRQSLRALKRLFAGVDASRPGTRLRDCVELVELVGSDSPANLIAETLLQNLARPVRALAFDKSPSLNWALGWHQDRTIAVRERRAVEGYEVWTMKSGVPHVEPPFELIASMVTLRLHLDDVPVDNAPLMIAPGSHQLGRVRESDVPTIVEDCGVVCCPARAGDIWAYRTSILHASERAVGERRRRVLQIDYSSDRLPGGLEWEGVSAA